MMKDKKELAVAALAFGTVIDHIPSDALFKVVKVLGLEHCDKALTIGVNLPSTGMGLKGIIKIADTTLSSEQLGKIAVIAPGAVVNVIEDYAISSKTTVTLPPRVVDVIRCSNPKCITNHEPMRTFFEVAATSPLTLRCEYCDHEVAGSEVVLK